MHRDNSSFRTDVSHVIFAMIRRNVIVNSSISIYDLVFRYLPYGRRSVFLADLGSLGSRSR
jgi:hypothetical protein